MVVHPTNMHLIWASGSLIVIKSANQAQNTYLTGHKGRVSALKCSKNGKMLASGELCEDLDDPNAYLIVWDFESKEMNFRVKYHRHMIAHLSFSCDDMFLISLGSLKDQNQLVVWNMDLGRSESTQQASDQPNQECTDVKFFNRDALKFATCHNNAIKIWKIFL